ncbi:hypothetical protein ACJIZ3_002065 [Penstemon smallii]|uniref:ZF-HD dimerization-type domain-containing protein n=1 Tax=Penstemon smallii TaxID=265156 RepID=A0ABD3U6K0_9LAMI
MELSNSTVKTPEAETETPTRIQPAKSSPFSNGVLKRHAPVHHHHHHAIVVTYKECLKNHAAPLGGHAVDGCGEFMPSPTSNPTDPTELKCAACGCHRNFHRREPEEPPLLQLPPPNTTPALEYQPHHRHHPPPPQRGNSEISPSPNNSPSPPPISSSYYPSAPHMLLALSHGMSGPPADVPISASPTPIFSSGSSRKRFRTKFSQDQKDKMLEFAERVGWKMQKRDEDVISEFCNEIGVDKGVFKVWMHNNKNTFSKKDHLSDNTIGISTPLPSSAVANGNGNGIGTNYSDNKDNVNGQEMSRHELHILGTNGSSSSS